MESPYRSMRIKGTSCPMFIKNIRKSSSVFCQIFKLYRTVLNKRHGFTIALH